MKYKSRIKLCAWTIWYMFPVQCEELRINYLTLLLVVTVPYACWFLWKRIILRTSGAVFILQFGVAFWRVVLRKIYFEGPIYIWRALKTSILNIGGEHLACGVGPCHFVTLIKLINVSKNLEISLHLQDSVVKILQIFSFQLTC